MKTGHHLLVLSLALVMLQMTLASGTVFNLASLLATNLKLK